MICALLLDLPHGKRPRRPCISGAPMHGGRVLNQKQVGVFPSRIRGDEHLGGPAPIRGEAGHPDAHGDSEGAAPRMDMEPSDLLT